MRPIVFDLDGVFCEWNHAMWRLLEYYGGAMRPFEQPEGPRLWEWERTYGASEEAVQGAWAHVRREKEWWAELPAHPDLDTLTARNLVGRLDQSGAEVLVVTARPHGLRRVTQEWLWEQLGVKWPVIVTPKMKWSALVALDPQIVVEDHPRTLEMTAGLGVVCERMLVQRPYNRGLYGAEVAVVGSTEVALRRCVEVVDG